MRPFSDGHVHATFQSHLEKICAEIDGLENEYVLKISQVELEQHFISTASINPIVLHIDKKYIEDQKGTKIDVSRDFRRAIFDGERVFVQGTQIEISIPFEGDPELWKIQPSRFGISGYPEIDVRQNSVCVAFSFPDDNPEPEELKGEIDRQINLLAQTVANLQDDVKNHNEKVSGIIKDAIEKKRQKALAATNAIESLGIEIIRRNEPLTFVLPVTRRKSPIQLPAVSSEPYAPEPAIAEDEYAHILNILRSMSLVIERNPHTFASLDEEAIRTHFLIQLNGHYEGGATGETFNAIGKTDILIRVGDRNTFIAECKFWRGPKDFSGAIDQLLGYLTWRDTKSALIIFNKNKNSSAVLKKMHEIMTTRQEHRRTISHDTADDSRYIFVKDCDPGREIIITTMLFDVPAQNNTACKL